MLTAILVIAGALALTFAFIWLGHERLATTDGQGVRFGGINALRAVAALGVVAAHTLTTSPLTGLPHFLVQYMATGVALFFVISGFLLYRPFAASLSDRAHVKIRSFATNRALRILPLYLVAVLVVFLASGIHSGQPGPLVARALTFTGVYSGHDLIPVAWSLDDEVAFYLLLPALYLALMAWPNPRQRLWLGAAVIGALSLASLAALALVPRDQAIVGGPMTKFFLFGFGMLLASLHSRWPAFELTRTHLVAGAVLIAAFLAASSLAYDSHSYLFGLTGGLAFFVMVGLVAFSGGLSPLTRVLMWRPLVHLGDVSYGIYLWHEPLHHVLYNSGLLSSSYVPGLLELACCSVALATGTYYLVEKPALRIKSRWVVSAPKRPAAQSIAAPATVGASAT